MVPKLKNLYMVKLGNIVKKCSNTYNDKTIKIKPANVK